MNDNGYQTRGNAWLNKTTDEYCVEKGAAVRFPGGDWIRVPSNVYYE